MVDHDALLKEIAERLTIMMMSAQCYVDEENTVIGYKIKTGSIHRIVGMMEGAGYTVMMPSNMPVIA